MKAPPGQGICFQIVMDLRAEFLRLFRKQFLLSEIKLKYVTLKNSFWIGVNMVFNPCFLYDPTLQAIK